jgi:hypothetical protein
MRYLDEQVLFLAAFSFVLPYLFQTPANYPEGSLNKLAIKYLEKKFALPNFENEMLDTYYESLFNKNDFWKPNPKTKFGIFFMQFKENSKKEYQNKMEKLEQQKLEEEKEMKATGKVLTSQDKFFKRIKIDKQIKSKILYSLLVKSNLLFDNFMSKLFYRGNEKAKGENSKYKFIWWWSTYIKQSSFRLHKYGHNRYKKFIRNLNLI